jgi:[acyl-carrier-protein] S-malonyltransferase
MPAREWIEGKVALVFPGQGSQFVGMGRDLFETSPAAQARLAEADEVLGFNLTGLMFEGPSAILEDTINAQPAILAASVAALAAMEERLRANDAVITPSFVAGHSLGEFSALVAAGVLDYASALQLVRERGRLMKEAGVEHPGGMAAVLGLDDALLKDICARVAGTGAVVVANANCPGQTVISGENDALEEAMDLARKEGAKRVTRLGVSIASHSPLMAEASAQFGALIAQTPMAEPSVPVVGNIEARPLTTVAEIQDEISRQMESPVNWTGSIQTMVALGVATFVELGPGAVLAGLNKRISRETPTRGLTDLGLETRG